MQEKWVMMNFSHIYGEETFWKEKEWQACFCQIDCTDIQGTNCYVSKEAEQEIAERIREFPPQGLHFIDSGNYHYVTRFWIEKIKEPFTLLVLDHHTDMQASAFAELTSCGDWIANALEHNGFIEEVVLIGPEEEAFASVNPKYRARLGRELPKGRNLYISVDKDVLSEKDARTNWDQGTLSLEEGKELLRRAMEDNTVIGMDICGEPDWNMQGGMTGEEREINDRCNRTFCELWLEYRRNI